MERKVECQTEAPRKPGPVSSLVALLSNPPGSNLKLRAFNHCAFTLVAPTLHVSSCHVLGTGPAPLPPPASKGFRVSCRLPRLFFFRFWDSSFCGWSPGPATYFFSSGPDCCFLTQSNVISHVSACVLIRWSLNSNLTGRRPKHVSLFCQLAIWIRVRCHLLSTGLKSMLAFYMQ